jgi:hypothetical protein
LSIYFVCKYFTISKNNLSIKNDINTYIFKGSELIMGTNRFHIFQKERSKNYNYIDRVVKNYLEQGGGLFHIYPMVSLVDSDGVSHEIGESGFYSSDPVFNESPKRKYSRETFDLWGVTTMNTPQFSFSFSGLSLLDSDEKEISFHYNSMVAQLGRKLLVGDVIEWTWLRDLDVLGLETAQNKFYQVTSSERDEKGWAANYKYHLWKVKIKPITNSPEFSDLFNTGKENDFYETVGSANGGGGLDPENTTTSNELAIMDQVLAEAEEDVSFRLHDEHHVYLDENNQIYVENRLISQGIDGIPNQLECEDVEFGEYFPINPTDGEYFLRTDFNPPRLFKRIVNEASNEGRWQLVEFDNREKWTGCPAILRSHINNDLTITNTDGETIKQRQNIKDLVKARVKKEHNKSRDWKTISKICPDMDVPTGV